FIGSSLIYNVTAESITVTSVKLKWVVDENASDLKMTYRIGVLNGTDDTLLVRQTTNEIEVEITGLIPGTLYNFTVFPIVYDNGTEGEEMSRKIYTRPSPVHNLTAESIGVTSVTLKWEVTDSASDSYTYRIEIVNGTFVENRRFNETKAEIANLTAGTLYNFTVFTVAADNETEGEGVSIDLYTRPSPVHNLTAESIGVTSVTLKWEMNDSASDSYTYRIEVVNGTDNTLLMNKPFSETKAEITGLI
ncbi:PTPRJ phosphatase, partial [Catharus fuscescens]|nr:PTPRJ phosphatase [Catharus fuscescens]